MYPVNTLDNYQKQANDLLAKIGQLQQFQPQIPAPVSIPQIDYVKGKDGAVEYLRNMPAGGRKILMDQDEAKFYVVSKDANGNPAPIAFASFVLETEQEPKAPEYVTKADFEEFKKDLKQMLQGAHNEPGNEHV